MAEQFHPAERESDTSPAMDDDLPAKAGTLHLWLIEPSAAPDDSRWQDRPIWRSVIVAAPSATFARLVAEQWAKADIKSQIGNESDSFYAGFNDEKLYQVRPAPTDFDPETTPSDWPGRVLVAHQLRAAPRLP
jgi:hypothetical protein